MVRSKVIGDCVRTTQYSKESIIELYHEWLFMTEDQCPQKFDKYTYQKSKDLIVTVKKVALGNLITPPFGVKAAFLVQRGKRLGWPSAINELYWNLGFVLLLGSWIYFLNTYKNPGFPRIKSTNNVNLGY